MSDMQHYFERAISERRHNSREDLISALVRAEEEHQALSAREVLAMCFLLLLGGNETTTNLLGSTVITLLNHPGELAKIRRDLSLVPQMIEEMLRYESPVQGIFRSATVRNRDRRHSDPGRWECADSLWFGQSRRAAVSPVPMFLMLRRNPQDHLGFGFGIHYCIGAPLARLEVRIAMDALLRRFPNLRMGEQQRELA